MRLAIGAILTLAALAVTGRRVWWLFRLVNTGQPARGRLDGIAGRLRAELVEVFGQRKLLKRSVPGLAHFFTFWGFVILAATIFEAYGALFADDFAIPLIGRGRWLGFLEDFFAMAVLVAVLVFAAIRVRQAPVRRQRASRFYGSHTGAAWVILAMISLVVLTLLGYRGAQVNTGHFPFGQSRWAFASYAVSRLLSGLSHDANYAIETTLILAQIAVILGFLVLVVYSKHLHIGTAPINVATKRMPKALGALLPMESGGQPIDFEDPGEDDVFGRGKVEDFTWRGMLDFATCTECGRCQDQCPAWNTGKPLSPKLVIMDLRDHLFAKAPYLLATNGDRPEEGKAVTGIEEDARPITATSKHVPESGFGRVPGSGPEQAERPLVGTLEEGGVIDPDVLWACTTCGACVEQCPVDIEHVDHIVDMRRYQVMIESEFPSELGGLFRNLENKGNPWGQNQRDRMEWAKGLDFEVPVITDVIGDDHEYLFWVGCAGAFEDKAKKTTRAVAELLHMAAVGFAVLGTGETCSGDPARRAGNEFLFQMLAQQNVETINAAFGGRKQKKIVVSCAHCFNTLLNEYPQLGGEYEVVHHTQLLNKLVRDKRLVRAVNPGQPVEMNVTYHDPCYLGRHNKVYTPPRELIGAAGSALSEMPRNSARSMCCGAGGARMWMEEKIGKRINLDRVDEALDTKAEKIVTGCPFCRIMLTDGLTARQGQEEPVGANVEVIDVAQMLLASVKGSA